MTAPVLLLIKIGVFIISLRVARHRRQVIEPEFIAEGTDSEDERVRRHDDDESSEEEELDEEEIERRRTLLKQRALQRKQEEVTQS